MMSTLYDEMAKIADRQGVRIESGYAAELNGMRREYPMVLWIPPDPKRIQGREERSVVYRCRFYWLEKDDGKASSADRERRWAEMERMAYRMVLALGEAEGVGRIGEVSGERDRHMLTPDGELSVKLEFDCEMILCDD